jgi:hypothetical protein
MGRMSAEGYKACVNEGLISEDIALHIHLTSNHYPPIPLTMIPVAKRAIVKANRGEWDKKVRMPEGVSHRVYGNLVPVHQVISHMHLDTFLDQGEEDYYE